MNALNYASLEASKRLVDAGIVLETEAVWRKKRDKTGYYLSRKALYHRTSDAPAPSMAEVWRELPETYMDGDHFLYLAIKTLQGHKQPSVPWRKDTKYAAGYMTDNGCVVTEHGNNNPTDALIDLLIWVRKEAKPC